jgi:hypothetical protein
MRYRHVLSVTLPLVLTCLWAASLSGQAPARGVAPKAVPRFPDGTINLGISSSEKGLWLPRDRTDLGRRSTLAPVETIPFQPWAKALYEDRQIHELEPHTRCHPSGAARQFQTPYGVDFVQIPELQRVFIIDVGGPHTYREIFMDNRPHPEGTPTSSYGHSVGHWEGETLVVETVGFSERFWLDRTGLPHTERLRTVERFTRRDFDTIKYEILIDDPNVYTKPWTGGFDLRWTGDTEVFEYVCQDNNTATQYMMKGDDPVYFTSPIVP